MKIGIIGLGLIGGSLAKALKRNSENYVIGFDVKKESLSHALNKKIIDEIALNCEDDFHSVDYLFLATPVEKTIEIMRLIPSWRLKENVIVSDTGSTKKEIMKVAQELTTVGITFIGAHPMAGSHKSGLSASKAHLFENAYMILTPLGNDISLIHSMKKLLEPTKAKVLVTSAQQHDEMTALVSHFPHLVATSLVHRLANEASDYPVAMKIAAGGFRDTTRIASGNPIMWRDITIQNREILLSQLQKWEEEMQRLKKLLSEGSPSDMEDYFISAKQVRDELPISNQGALYSTFDLSVDVPDYPGVISELTGLLAEHMISLTNLRIVEAREDIYGIFVISFQTASDRQRAQELIQTKTAYESYIS
ncbi:prephenate dehydrogenase [Paenisporosarcina cavernae]|uniref:Prephenate dehydrogenase n=1 Tax=Paenisporosarcina cavernae TaxID=2320858 RepID=A0A385YSB2_9BACL|nr:prephenate dehydrogenase [Paenisporosarcina cavernae]AYC29394.1 prephenate dehydrogenase [Paenisporosarcina cavernae]